MLVEMSGRPLSPGNVFENGILFGSNPTGISGETDVWALLGERTQPELAFIEMNPRSVLPIGTQLPGKRAPHAHPRPSWRLPAGVRVLDQAAAFDGDRLWVFDGSLAVTSEAGRHGTLFGFVPGDRQPISIPLRLDLPAHVLSSPALQRAVGFGAFGQKILCATPKGLALVSRALPGLWWIPRAALKARWAEEARLREAQREAHAARQKQLEEVLLRKFDLNRDGHFQPHEAGALIGSADFLELRRDEIDANGNGTLEADEIAFFDANRNRRLEDQEFSAIETFLGLLADEILADHDQDGDGRLQEEEWELPKWRVARTQFRFPNQPRALDRDGDQALSRDEIRHYLLQAATSDVCRSRSPITRPLGPARTQSEIETATLLRTGIETLWANESRFRANAASGPEAIPKPQ